MDRIDVRTVLERGQRDEQLWSAAGDRRWRFAALEGIEMLEQAGKRIEAHMLPFFTEHLQFEEQPRR